MMLTAIRNTIRNFVRPRAVILMYHQVCERTHDPWSLAVAPDVFDEQLEALKREFDVVSVEEIARNVARRTVRNKMAAITFDDGFLDNFTEARPALERHCLPATFYLTTHPVRSGKLFWWETLQQIIFMSGELPRSLSLTVGEEQFRFDFKRDHLLTSEVQRELRQWNASAVPVNERISLFMRLWQKMQPLSAAQQEGLLLRIMAWSGNESIQDNDRKVMSVEDARTLIRNPLFTVGAHSVNHAMLAEQDVEIQSYEVKQSKKDLETQLGCPIHGFSYPYGNYNSTTKSLLQEAGFRSAVSAESRCVTEQDDIFELPRIHVGNWSGKELVNHLNKHWLS